MKKGDSRIEKRLSCQIPRKGKALEALLSLAWKKNKKHRPKWLVEELESIL